MKRMVLAMLLVPFILGITTQHVTNFPIPNILLYLNCLLGIQVILCGFGFFTIRSSFFSSLAIYFSVFLLGFVSFQDHDWNKIASGLEKEKNESIYLAKIIEAKKGHYYLNIKAQGSSLFNLKKCQFKILAKTNDRLEKLSIGDNVLFKSVLKEIPDNLNPTSFNYKEYLHKQYIFYQINLADVTLTAFANQDSNFHSTLHNFKNKGLSILETRFSNKPSVLGISAAMLFGDRTFLDKETKQTFSETGMMHILAVSGMHVGIIAMLLFFLLNYMLPNTFGFRHLKWFIGVLSIWLFAVFTGASPSVLRAALMFNLFALSKFISGNSYVYQILTLSAFILLIIQPHLLFNVSFQLSYLAMFSIIFFYDYIYKICLFENRILSTLWSFESLAISAQIMVFPISIYYFNQFPPSFLLTAIISIPLSFLVVIGSMLTIFLDVIHCHFVNNFFFQSLYSETVNLSIDLVKSIQQLDYACIKNIQLDGIDLTLLYCAIGFLICVIRYKKSVFIWLSLIPILLFSLKTTLVKYEKKQDQSIAIYHHYNHLLVDVFQADGLHSFRSKSIRDNTINYISSAHRSNKTHNLSNSVFELNNESNYFAIKDNVFCIWNKESTQEYSNLNIDFLLFHKDSSLESFKKLIDHNSIQKLIISSNVPRYVYSDIFTLCEQKGIPYYNIGKSGAFIQDF